MKKSLTVLFLFCVFVSSAQVIRISATGEDPTLVKEGRTITTNDTLEADRNTQYWISPVSDLTVRLEPGTISNGNSFYLDLTRVDTSTVNLVSHDTLIFKGERLLDIPLNIDFSHIKITRREGRYYVYVNRPFDVNPPATETYVITPEIAETNRTVVLSLDGYDPLEYIPLPSFLGDGFGAEAIPFYDTATEEWKINLIGLATVVGTLTLVVDFIEAL